jgi:hypothetical protein
MKSKNTVKAIKLMAAGFILAPALAMADSSALAALTATAGSDATAQTATVAVPAAAPADQVQALIAQLRNLENESFVHDTSWTEDFDFGITDQYHATSFKVSFQFKQRELGIKKTVSDYEVGNLLLQGKKVVIDRTNLLYGTCAGVCPGIGNSPNEADIEGNFESGTYYGILQTRNISSDVVASASDLERYVASLMSRAQQLEALKAKLGR